MLVSTIIAVAAALVVAGCLTRVSMFRECLADIGGRTPQIDGLRGVCALVVAAHHLVYFTYLRSSGEWKIAPPDHSLETMGKAGVAYFFLVCAYLFWGKMFRPGLVIDIAFLANFMRGRVRRLVPLYLAAMVFSLLIVGFVGQGCHLVQGPIETLDQILRSISFSFFGFAAFNGSFLTFAATSVSWSLEYEWVFYAVLPVLALLGLNRWWFVTLPALLVANGVWFGFSYLDYFVYGALARELTKPDTAIGLVPLMRRLPDWVWNIVSIGLAVFVLDTVTGVDIGHAPTSLLVFLSILPVAWGADWFGVLRSKAARLVGAISYSVYLLNIPLLYVMTSFWADGAFGGIAGVATETLSLVAIIACCTLTYRRIERPFILGSASSRSAAVDVCATWQGAKLA